MHHLLKAIHNHIERVGQDILPDDEFQSLLDTQGSLQKAIEVNKQWHKRVDAVGFGNPHNTAIKDACGNINFHINELTDQWRKELDKVAAIIQKQESARKDLARLKIRKDLADMAAKVSSGPVYDFHVSAIWLCRDECLKDLHRAMSTLCNSLPAEDEQDEDHYNG